MNMHKNTICTIINITQQNDNYMLRRSGLKDLSTHSLGAVGVERKGQAGLRLFR